MLTRLITLAAYTVLPLVGVLTLGWDWREIVLLYWLENVSIGVATVIWMLRSVDAPSSDDSAALGKPRADDPAALDKQRVTGRPPRVTGRPLRGDDPARTLASFFALHYGTFTVMHGVFVLLLVNGVFSPTPSTQSPLNWVSALIVWLIGGTAQVLAARFGPPPEQLGARLMFSAYPRMIVLHVSVIVGISIIESFDWPAAAAIFLIGLHALVDGAAWMISAARDRARASGPRPRRP